MRTLNRMRLAAALALACGVTPWPAAAQWGPNQTRFLGVKGWTGSFSISLKTAGTSTLAGFPTSYDVNYSVAGTIRAEPYDPGLGGWVGTVNGTATINYTLKSSMGDCSLTTAGKGTSSINTQPGGAPSAAYVTLDLERGSDTYSFWLLAGEADVNQVMTFACPDVTTSIPSTVQVGWNPTNRSEALPFPASGFTLAGQKKMLGPVAVGVALEQMEYDVAWNLIPTATKELELIIDAEGYDTWRPEATMSEEKPGNKIAVKASLRWNDGTPLSADTRAQSFIFDLAKVSHEPGVALNFPIKDGKATADLQFVEEENQNFKVSGSEKQRAETIPMGSGTEATVVVSSFDWGGWGEIQATAVLPGGQTIKGYLRGDKSQTSVRLPKRPSTSFIADVWKQQQGIDKQDNDDSEPNPAGLAGCDGDGFTLYEEYRGFHENGKHIEGNPKKKDFFILNLVGAEAEAGIWLFTDLTDLEVHKDLTQEEFVFQERLINKNHDQGPHRVDQHGVFITTCTNVNGGSTGFSESGLRGRPYLTLGICIQDRFDASKALGKQYMLSNTDFAEIYDKAVAHELLHSIGGEHHGDGDKVLPVKLVFPDDPKNTLGRPYFQDYQAEVEIQLRDEKTRLDPLQQGLYEAIRKVYDAALAELDRLVAAGVVDAEMLAATREFTKILLTTREYQFGVKSGQHSGDDQCVMRYNMAEVYQAEGRTDLYYLVPAGTEPSGLQLCLAGQGTGVNQAGRDPQPRYFNAAAGRGSCKFWVCPNDAIPPGKP